MNYMSYRYRSRSARRLTIRTVCLMAVNRRIDSSPMTTKELADLTREVYRQALNKDLFQMSSSAMPQFFGVDNSKSIRWNIRAIMIKMLKY